MRVARFAPARKRAHRRNAAQRRFRREQKEGAPFPQMQARALCSKRLRAHVALRAERVKARVGEGVEDVHAAREGVLHVPREKVSCGFAKGLPRRRAGGRNREVGARGADRARELRGNFAEFEGRAQDFVGVAPPCRVERFIETRGGVAENDAKRSEHFLTNRGIESRKNLFGGVANEQKAARHGFGRNVFSPTGGEPLEIRARTSGRVGDGRFGKGFGIGEARERALGVRPERRAKRNAVNVDHGSVLSVSEAPRAPSRRTRS